MDNSNQMVSNSTPNSNIIINNYSNFHNGFNNGAYLATTTTSIQNECNRSDEYILSNLDNNKTNSHHQVINGEISKKQENEEDDNIINETENSSLITNNQLNNNWSSSPPLSSTTTPSTSYYYYPSLAPSLPATQHAALNNNLIYNNSHLMASSSSPSNSSLSSTSSSSSSPSTNQSSMMIINGNNNNSNSFNPSSYYDFNSQSSSSSSNSSLSSSSSSSSAGVNYYHNVNNNVHHHNSHYNHHASNHLTTSAISIHHLNHNHNRSILNTNTHNTTSSNSTLTASNNKDKIWLNTNKTSSSSSSSSSSSPILNNTYTHQNNQIEIGGGCGNGGHNYSQTINPSIASSSSSFILDSSNTFQAPAPLPSSSVPPTKCFLKTMTTTKQPSFDNQIPLYSNQITSTTPSDVNTTTTTSSSFLNNLASIKVESNFYLPSSSSPPNQTNDSMMSTFALNKQKISKSSLTSATTTLKHKNSLKRKKSHLHHHNSHHNHISDHINSHHHAAKLFKTEKCDICSMSGGSEGSDEITKTIPCESCKNFFRRYTTSKKFTLNSNGNSNRLLQQQCYCTSTANSICSFCRFERCVRLAGMKPSVTLAQLPSSSLTSLPLQHFSNATNSLLPQDNHSQLVSHQMTTYNNDMGQNSIATSIDQQQQQLWSHQQNESVTAANFMRIIAREIEHKRGAIRSAHDETRVNELLFELSQNVLNTFLQRTTQTQIITTASMTMLKRSLLITYAYLIEHLNENEEINSNLTSTSSSSSSFGNFIKNLSTYEQNIASQLNRIYSSAINLLGIDSSTVSSSTSSSSTSFISYNNTSYNSTTYNQSSSLNDLKMLHFLLILFNSFMHHFDEEDSDFDIENENGDLMEEVNGNTINNNNTGFIDINEETNLNLDQKYNIINETSNENAVDEFSFVDLQDMNAVTDLTKHNDFVNLNNKAKRQQNSSSKTLAMDAFECQKFIVKLIDRILTNSSSFNSNSSNCKIIKTKILLSIADLDI